MRTLVSGFLILSLFGLSTVACGAGVVRPESDHHAAVSVLRFRWIKRLTPETPNLLVPEMQEEHDRFFPVEWGSAGFDTDKRRAFVGVSVGGLYCLDVRSGRTIWRFDLKDGVGSTPLYDPERKTVYVGADDGNIYALHARSGRLLWSAETGAQVRRPFHLKNGTLYVVNADNTVFALDPDRGEVIWEYRRPPMEGFTSAGHAGLAWHNESLITGFSDGYVVALEGTTGSVIWEQDLASEILASAKAEDVQLIDADATPVVAGSMVVVSSVLGGLFGLDAETGAVRWSDSTVTSVTGLGLGSGVGYAARTGFGLTAFDPETGRIEWSKRFETGMLVDPVVYDDVIILVDSEYGLSIVSTVEGRLLQRLDANEGFYARPAIHAGYLLVVGNGGTLFAMSIM